MILKKPLKTFLFPAANILLTLFMLRSFFIADLNIVRTFYCADLASLGSLVPHPMDYLWDLNINHVPMNKKRLRYYTDYFEQLLKVFPSLRDTYGLLGYCYHYLGDDAKAIEYLKKAIEYNPLYPWNYYNLAAIYVYQSRYKEAATLFEKIQYLDPQAALSRLFASHEVYDPLLVVGGDNSVSPLADHLKMCYTVSFDLVQLLKQGMNNKNVDAIINRDIKLDLYAF